MDCYCCPNISPHLLPKSDWNRYQATVIVNPWPGTQAWWWWSQEFSSRHKSDMWAVMKDLLCQTQCVCGWDHTCCSLGGSSLVSRVSRSITFHKSVLCSRGNIGVVHGVSPLALSRQLIEIQMELCDWKSWSKGCNSSGQKAVSYGCAHHVLQCHEISGLSQFFLFVCFVSFNCFFMREIPITLFWHLSVWFFKYSIWLSISICRYSTESWSNTSATHWGKKRACTWFFSNW